jgi:hypothetical protein
MITQKELKKLFDYKKDGNFYNRFTRSSNAIKDVIAGYIVSYPANDNNKNPLKYRYISIKKKIEPINEPNESNGI